jgi:hypothetical protein
LRFTPQADGPVNHQLGHIVCRLLSSAKEAAYS